MSSFWPTTCSNLARGQEPAWAEVMDYDAPIASFLKARFRQLPGDVVEDLVQEILLDIKARLYHGYSKDRGKFRAFLLGVIRNKVFTWLRRQGRMQSMEWVEPEAAVTPRDVAPLDFLADLTGALRRWHDRALVDDARRVFVMSKVLSKQQTFKAIAAEENLPAHQVKRMFHHAREEILGDFLSRQLDLPDTEKIGLDWVRLARLLLKIMKSPRKRHRLLAEIGQQALQTAFEDWLEGFASLREVLDQDTHLEEFRQGIESMFQPA